MNNQWRPISEAPENVNILTYAEWGDSSMQVSRYVWETEVREEIQSETTNRLGRRRIIQEKEVRCRRWILGHHEPEWWVPLPNAPDETTVPAAATDSTAQIAAPAVGEQTAQRVLRLLKGIDQTEIESPDGWWETSAGADFGKRKLSELKSALASAPEAAGQE